MAEILTGEPSPYISIMLGPALIQLLNNTLKQYTTKQKMLVTPYIGTIYFIMQIKPIRKQILTSKYKQSQFIDDIIFISIFTLYPIVIEKQFYEVKIKCLLIAYTVVEALVQIAKTNFNGLRSYNVSVYLLSGIFFIILTQKFLFNILLTIMWIIIDDFGFGYNLKFIFNVYLLLIFESIQAILNWETTQEYWGQYFRSNQ